MKIIIKNYSAELPDQTEIELTNEQAKSLWTALERPRKEHLNRDSMKEIYGIEFGFKNKS